MHTPPRLNLPPAPLRFGRDGNAVTVFDPLRAKWVTLTPEEWVRQHFTSFLTTHRGVPRSLIAKETGITLNGTLKRCDTVIYTPSLTPLAIVEYKAPTVAISRKVFEQIIRYNIVLKTRYLIVSNGMSHYCCEVDKDTGGCRLLADIPPYEEMLAGL